VHSTPSHLTLTWLTEHHSFHIAALKEIAQTPNAIDADGNLVAKIDIPPPPEVPVFTWHEETRTVIEDVEYPLPPQPFAVKSNVRKSVIYAHFVMLHATIINISEAIQV
jgi:hypothetical protein